MNPKPPAPERGPCRKKKSRPAVNHPNQSCLPRSNVSAGPFDLHSIEGSRIIEELAPPVEV